MASLSASGSCLCGSIIINCASLKPHVGACHCNLCRKWSSGPLFYVESEGECQISGEDGLTFFESSVRAERAFCKICGSNIYYRDKSSGHLAFSAGLFANDLPVNFNMQLYIDEKPSYYRLANDTNSMTGADILAYTQKEQE